MAITMTDSTAKQGGFTLIELMLVVVIIAIIAAIAMPMYGDYIQQARRTDATNALSRAATQQERYYMRNNAYSGDVDDIGGDGSGSLESENGYYDITSSVAGCEDGDGSCFTLTATAINSKSQWNDEDCRSFTLTDAGFKASTDQSGAASADCW